MAFLNSSMVQSEIGATPFRVTHNNGRHVFYGDEPANLGGGDTAPMPDELLEAALATCTLVTLRMYTTHKQWQVGTIQVEVALERTPERTTITRSLQFQQPLEPSQLERLIQVAKACPVSKTLAGNNEMIVDIKSAS